MRDYVVKQLKEKAIRTLEKGVGGQVDIDRLRQDTQRTAQAEDEVVKALESAKNRPLPDRRVTSARCNYIGLIFTVFAHARR